MSSQPTAAATTGADSDSPKPGARLALVLLLVINLFNYIDRQVLAAVESPISGELLPADPNALTKMGTLAWWFLISYMLAAPVFGWLADRMSRWVLIGVGVIAWSLASGGSGLAPSFLILMITRMFVGLGEAAYGPAAPTIISDYYPVKRRGAVLAWFYMAIPVGSALGYGLGGLMHSLVDWRWAFYVVVPPGILLGVLCFFMREPPRVRTADHKPAGPGDYLKLLKIPSYVLNTLGMTAMTFSVGGIAFWMPRYIHEFRGEADLARVNLIFGGITAVSGLIATLVGGLLGDKLRPRFSGSYFLISGVGMLFGFPLFLAVLFVPFPLAWVFLFLAVFCLFLNTGPTNAILANVTHPSIRSPGFALNILVIHALGDAISPTVIGAVADATGGNFNVAFGVVSAMILASGLFWIWGARHLERDTAAAEPEAPTAPAPPAP